ncbi:MULTISPECIES: hypothetical protein [Sphingobacterium]|uniref:hypothetical protein n=1 Tax=Sphingobacterium TaxID=28453 RepID=UPI0013DC6786|nr:MULTISPECIES: hypothetical protein [unclassified Sphingobacterium]
MKDIKIYISLSEAESLVFNKALIIPSYRQAVDRAQKSWAIAIYLNHEALQLDDNFFLILSSNIKCFEIPEREESLFLNHFKIPKGLYFTIDRKFRDGKEVKDIFDSTAESIITEEQIFVFKGIRRGVLQCYQLAINEKVSKAFIHTALSLINSLEKWDPFHILFINEVVRNQFYPILDINDGKFHTEAFKRFIWLGRYTFEYLSKDNTYSDDHIAEGKQWLKALSDKNNTETIVDTIKKSPLIFADHYEFLLGYYVASSFYEEANVGEGYYFYLQQILDEIGLGKNTFVLFWSIFFQSIYKDEIDFLYFIPSLQKDQEIIEKSILSLFCSNIELNNSKSNLPSINEHDRLTEYIQLLKGGNLKDLKIITQEELRSLYKNNVNSSSLRSMGFELEPSQFSFDFIRNKCQFGRDGFLINLQSKPYEVTFYLVKGSESEIWLKDLKIKTKPIRKLIDGSKKVLVSFIEIGAYDRSLLSFYEYLVSQHEKEEIFKETVIVLMVDESLEYVQSIEFQRDKLKIENYCRSVFGANCHVLVKNLNNNSDGEIKRNLKHIIEKYQIKDVELVDENIDDTILEWMISANISYILDSEVKKSYSIINL